MSGQTALPVKHLALPYQVLYGSRHIFYRHIRVGAVLVIQVDVVRLQAAERAFHRFPYGFGTGIGYQRIGYSPASQVEPQAELRGDDHLFPIRFQGIAQQFLVVVRIIGRAIHFGGVEEVVAHIHSLCQQLRHFPMVGRRTVGVAHSHTAQADG